MSGKVTKAQREMLERIAECGAAGWDGICPFGAGEWATIRALKRKGLVKYEGVGQDCSIHHPREEALVYALTDEGSRIHHALPLNSARPEPATPEGRR